MKLELHKEGNYHCSRWDRSSVIWNETQEGRIEFLAPLKELTMIRIVFGSRSRFSLISFEGNRLVLSREEACFEWYSLYVFIDLVAKSSEMPTPHINQIDYKFQTFCQCCSAFGSASSFVIRSSIKIWLCISHLSSH